MHRRFTVRSRMGLLLAALLSTVALGACGSSATTSGSTGSAQSLLAQTFSGARSVRSGVLGFALTVDPAGSSTVTTPISLSLSGPFQSRAAGKIPSSDFTVSINALGRHGALGVISTGTSGYVTLQGSAYTLPAADFQRLESSFSSVGAGGHSGLSGLGINPEHWLQNPSIVGTTTLNGAQTTHIRAGVNIAALLADLNTFLAKTKSTTAGSSAIPTTIPPATQQRIAQEVHGASVDVWTGTSDHLLRKLALALTIPVHGQVSTLLGGLSSAGLGLTIQYSDLNQPQTIVAPHSVAPYSQFTAKLHSLFSAVQGSLGGSSSSGSSPGSASGSSSGSGSATSSANSYSACIAAAGQDVTKMQKCASLISG
jgi:hypothetical protein